MRSTILAGILMIVLGVLGVGWTTAAAFGQGATMPGMGGGMNMMSGMGMLCMFVGGTVH